MAIRTIYQCSVQYIFEDRISYNDPIRSEVIDRFDDFSRDVESRLPGAYRDTGFCCQGEGIQITTEDYVEAGAIDCELQSLASVLESMGWIKVL